MYNFNSSGNEGYLTNKFLDSNRNLLNDNSTYGSLPSKFRTHGRHYSDAARSLSTEEQIPTPVTKTRKTSVFSGLASKLKQTFDGNRNAPVANENHRPLRVSLSDFGSCGSVEYLGEEQKPFRKQSSVKFRPRLFQNIYSSQRKISSKQRSQEKLQIKTNNISTHPSFKPKDQNDNLSLPSSPVFCRTRSYDERQRTVLRQDYNKFITSNSSDNITPVRHKKQPKDNRKFDKNQNRNTSIQTTPKLEVSSEETQEMKLVVMGSERVGKSAIVVRFLTKRFIGEYVPKVESVNVHDLHSSSGSKIHLHVWDSALPEISPPLTPDMLNNDEPPGENMFESMSSSSSSSSLNQEFPEELEEDAIDDGVTNENIKALERMEWADGIVLVYNICDIKSFRKVQNMVRFIRGHTHTHTDDFRKLRQSISTPNHRNNNRDSGFLSGTGSRPNSGSCETSPTGPEPISPNKPPISQMPLILLGNKLDLQHRREVPSNDCKLFASAYGCLCRELSASDGFEPVSEAFEEIIEAVQKSTMPSTITRLRTMVRKIRHRRNKST